MFGRKPDFADGQASPSLPIRSKLVKREQVNHSSAFKAPFAQPHNMLSHEQCLRVLSFGKTKGPARIRIGCGHDSDLSRLECLSRYKRRNRHATPPPLIVTPTHLDTVEEGEVVSDLLPDSNRPTEHLVEVDRHKKEPWAIHGPRVSTGCCLSGASSLRGTFNLARVFNSSGLAVPM